MTHENPNNISARVPSIGEVIQFAEHDWRVLDVQEGRLLLLSEKIIEKRRYQFARGCEAIWEKCALRGYLNRVFYDSLGLEKSRIAETRLSNDDNLWYGAKGCEATIDKIFPLSIEEADRYFGDSGDYFEKRRYSHDDRDNFKIIPHDRGGLLSNEYDAGRIAYDDGGEAASWWLRSPGYYDTAAASVTREGCIMVFGYHVYSSPCGVRPALWLML